MADPSSLDRACIIDITLDTGPIIRWNPDIEHERQIAIFDLLEDNRFSLSEGPLGPYRLRLSVTENHIVFNVQADQSEDDPIPVILPHTVLRRIIRDYFTVCDSYFSAIKNARPSQIEALDMGRRGVHNEGAELLRERLAASVDMDDETARRLFTLVCVLHLRG